VVFNGGNVGVGTTAPSQNLHISSSSNPTLYIERTSADGTSSRILTSGNFVISPLSELATLGGAQGTNNGFFLGNGFLGISGYNTVRFYTTASERMRLFSNGNLAINTTTDAGFKLDVNGTARVQGNMDIGTSATASTITIPQATGFTDFTITNNTAANTGVRFRNTAGTRTISITGVNLDLSLSNGIVSSGGGFSTGNISMGSLATGLANTVIKGFNNCQINMNGDDMAIHSRPNTASPLRLLSGSSSATSKGTTYISDYSNLATTVNASATLQVDSTVQGFLPPRMTTTQKNAIATPASGLVVYDTTLGKLCVRGASAWETITSI
jgi:hypothetical protein